MLPKKQKHSLISLISSGVSAIILEKIIPTKRIQNFLSAFLMPIKGKVGVAISKAIIGSSQLVFFNSWLTLSKFPSLDKLWLVFEDLNFANYLKKVSTYKKYSRMVKYFCDRLIFIVQRLYFSKIQAILWLILLLWYIAMKTNV